MEPDQQLPSQVPRAQPSQAGQSTPGWHLAPKNHHSSQPRTSWLAPRQRHLASAWSPKQQRRMMTWTSLKTWWEGETSWMIVCSRSRKVRSATPSASSRSQRRRRSGKRKRRSLQWARKMLHISNLMSWRTIWMGSKLMSSTHTALGIISRPKLKVFSVLIRGLIQ